jgi:molybdenum cofactor biosynthesis enzyme
MAQVKNQKADSNSQSVAFLSNQKNMTSFSFGNQTIRFRAPDKLIRYTAVKEWDKGYIVVMAKYAGIGEVKNTLTWFQFCKIFILMKRHF